MTDARAKAHDVSIKHQAAKGLKPPEKAQFAVGDLVMLRNDTSKTKARDTFIVVEMTEDGNLIIKRLNNQLRQKNYVVKHSDLIHHSCYRPGPNCGGTSHLDDAPELLDGHDLKHASYSENIYSEDVQQSETDDENKSPEPVDAREAVQEQIQDKTQDVPEPSHSKRKHSPDHSETSRKKPSDQNPNITVKVKQHPHKVATKAASRPRRAAAVAADAARKNWLRIVAKLPKYKHGWVMADQSNDDLDYYLELAYDQCLEASANDTPPVDDSLEEAPPSPIKPAKSRESVIVSAKSLPKCPPRPTTPPIVVTTTSFPLPPSPSRASRPSRAVQKRDYMKLHTRGFSS